MEQLKYLILKGEKNKAVDLACELFLKTHPEIPLRPCQIYGNYMFELLWNSMKTTTVAIKDTIETEIIHCVSWCEPDFNSRVLEEFSEYIDLESKLFDNEHGNQENNISLAKRYYKLQDYYKKKNTTDGTVHYSKLLLRILYMEFQCILNSCIDVKLPLFSWSTCDSYQLYGNDYTAESNNDHPQRCHDITYSYEHESYFPNLINQFSIMYMSSCLWFIDFEERVLPTLKPFCLINIIGTLDENRLNQSIKDLQEANKKEDKRRIEKDMERCEKWINLVKNETIFRISEEYGFFIGIYTPTEKNKAQVKAKLEILQEVVKTIFQNKKLSCIQFWKEAIN
jgi:hypothetical protein